MHDIPYAIELQRNLTEVERDLLVFLLRQEMPQQVTKVDSLKVIGRCGCGKCPTILIGQGQHPFPTIGEFKEIANYIGKNSQGVLAGVALLEREGGLFELEAWSPSGDNVMQWPMVTSLERTTPSLG